MLSIPGAPSALMSSCLYHYVMPSRTFYPDVACIVIGHLCVVLLMYRVCCKVMRVCVEVMVISRCVWRVCAVCDSGCTVF